MTPLLVSIPYSPWSRRAVHSLKRAGVAFDKRTYTPTLSEPWLRWKLGRWRGPLTVPVLFTDDGPLTDSLAIAYWASDRSASPLAPAELRDDIARWNQRSEQALAAGRLLTTQAVLERPEALRASLPPEVAALGPLGGAIGRDAARRLLRKYGDGRTAAAHHDLLAEYCAELRGALAGGEHLLGRVSYADITAAIGLSFIAPDADARVAPAARPCWTRDTLAAAYPDLLAWRDRVLGAARLGAAATEET